MDLSENEILRNPFGQKIGFERTSDLSYQTFIEGYTQSKFSKFFTASFIDSSKKSSISTTSLGIMNTVMGAGIIGLPFILRQFGLILGVIMLIAIYFLTVYTCRFLLMVKNLSGLADYKEIGQYTFGRAGEIIIKIIIIINNFGINVAFFIIFGGAFQNIVKPFCEGSQCWYCSSFFYNKKFFILCIFCIQLPLIFAKSMAKMRIASYINILAISTFCICCIAVFFVKLAKHDLPDMVWVPSGKVFVFKKALGCFTNIFMAYTFHFNWFPLYRSLATPTNHRMMKSGWLGLFGCCLMYSLVAMAGVASYGDEVSVNFITSVNNKNIGNGLYLTLTISYTICCGCSLPFIYFELRNYLLSLYHDIEIAILKKKIQHEFSPSTDKLLENPQSNDNRQNQFLINKLKSQEFVPLKEDGEQHKIQKFSKETPKESFIFYIIFSFTFYAITLIPGLFIQEVGFVFGLIGAVGCNSIAYLMPSLFYIKLTKNRKGFYLKLAYFVLIFGTVSGILSIVSNCLNL